MKSKLSVQGIVIEKIGMIIQRDRERERERHTHRVDNIVNNNIHLVQHNDYNKKAKSNVIISGDSMLNNINSRGLSKYQ